MALDEQRIRAMMKEEIRNANNSLRFQQTAIPRHTHNGVDSPALTIPTMTYIGTVNKDGDPYANLPFPKGWGRSHTGTGSYSFQHNLGTLKYTVVATVLYTPDVAEHRAVCFVDNLTPNTFDINWFLTSTGVPADISFSFQVTTIANTTPGWPAYNNTNIFS